MKRKNKNQLILTGMLALVLVLAMAVPMHFSKAEEADEQPQASATLPVATQTVTPRPVATQAPEPSATVQVVYVTVMPTRPTFITPPPTATPTATPTPKLGVTITSPLIVSVKNRPHKKMAVCWQMVSGASGYQMQYSTNKKMKSAIMLKTIAATSTKKVLKKLKKKTYYVRMRTYVAVNGGIKYSKWSKKRKCRIKK